MYVITKAKCVHQDPNMPDICKIRSPLSADHSICTTLSVTASKKCIATILNIMLVNRFAMINHAYIM